MPASLGAVYCPFCNQRSVEVESVKKQRQFALFGAVLVGVVGYLLVTGMKDSAM